MSNTIEKPIDLIKTLTVDWQSNLLVQTANPDIGFFNKVVTQTDPLKKGWRLPWDILDDENINSMNYHVTINPDPHCDWITQVNDLKTHNNRYRLFLRDCIKNRLYKNIISVYEYGKNGKEYGKVHYHILLQTNKINKFIEMAITYFGTSNKTRWRNTVVKAPITIDKCLNTYASDIEKVENYRKQINYIMEKYMRKESQNRHKCLYTNMEKKV